MRIEVPDDIATALQSQAAAQGMSLEAWFEKLARIAAAKAPLHPRRIDAAMRPSGALVR
jgi:hypothetical protein